MHSNLLAVLFALASSLVIAWGTVVRHRIAKAPESPAAQSVLFTAIKRPMWWVGTASALAGYGLQIVALGFGTLLVVQPILVLSLMFTLPLSARYDRRRLAVDEMSWAGVLTIAVGTLVILGDPSPGLEQPPMNRWLPAIAIGAVVLLLLGFWATRTTENLRALLFGMVTGGIYGYVAVLSKATVDVFTHEGLLALILAWELYSLIALAALGTVVQQYAFNAGRLKNSLPAMTVVEPIVAFALGYSVLGEQFQVSGWNWTIMAGALIAMVLSTIALSSRRVG